MTITKHQKSADTHTQKRITSDNLCKALAEKYPEQFVRWVFGSQAGKIKVMKTELSREPIRADSVILAGETGEIFHVEFQTTIKSNAPLPLRMLDYYVGFKRQHQEKRIRQTLIVLKESSEEIVDRYEDERTFHGYDVIKMWEQNAQKLMRHEGLLPLATLCRAEPGKHLLKEIAAKIQKIKSKDERREKISMSQVLAGLRYDRNLVYEIFKEVDMLEESSVYKDIIQRGLQQGRQEGRQEGLQEGLQHERYLITRMLKKRFGRLSSPSLKQIDSLSKEQVEALSEALLDFKNKAELTSWLNEHLSAR